MGTVIGGAAGGATMRNDLDFVGDGADVGPDAVADGEIEALQGESRRRMWRLPGGSSRATMSWVLPLMLSLPASS